MNKLIIVFSLLLVSPVFANSILKDFSTLGNSESLLKAAKNLNTESQISIVQKRNVNRFERHELGIDHVLLSGGNPYMDSTDLSLVYQYHLNPRWSFSAKYTQYFNKLTSEGERLIKDGIILTENSPNLAFIPELDYPKSAYTGTVNWYPVYGKINLYNLGVIPFDFYVNAGYGIMSLDLGSSNAYSVGMGFAFWVSKKLSARIESQYRTHSFRTGRENQKESLDLTTFGISLGYLL